MSSKSYIPPISGYLSWELEQMLLKKAFVPCDTNEGGIIQVRGRRLVITDRPLADTDFIQGVKDRIYQENVKPNPDLDFVYREGLVLMFRVLGFVVITPQDGGRPFVRKYEPGLDLVADKFTDEEIDLVFAGAHPVVPSPTFAYMVWTNMTDRVKKALIALRRNGVPPNVHAVIDEAIKVVIVEDKVELLRYFRPLYGPEIRTYNTGRTVLHLCCMYGGYKCYLEELAFSPGYLNVKDNFGWIPIALCIRASHIGVVPELIYNLRHTELTRFGYLSVRNGDSVFVNETFCIAKHISRQTSWCNQNITSLQALFRMMLSDVMEICRIDPTVDRWKTGMFDFRLWQLFVSNFVKAFLTWSDKEKNSRAVKDIIMGILFTLEDNTMWVYYIDSIRNRQCVFLTTHTYQEDKQKMMKVTRADVFKQMCHFLSEHMSRLVKNSVSNVTLKKHIISCYRGNILMPILSDHEKNGCDLCWALYALNHCFPMAVRLDGLGLEIQCGGSEKPDVWKEMQTHVVKMAMRLIWSYVAALRSLSISEQRVIQDIFRDLLSLTSMHYGYYISRDDRLMHCQTQRILHHTITTLCQNRTVKVRETVAKDHKVDISGYKGSPLLEFLDSVPSLLQLAKIRILENLLYVEQCDSLDAINYLPVPNALKTFLLETDIGTDEMDPDVNIGHAISERRIKWKTSKNDSSGFYDISKYSNLSSS